MRHSVLRELRFILEEVRGYKSGYAHAWATRGDHQSLAVANGIAGIERMLEQRIAETEHATKLAATITTVTTENAYGKAQQYLAQREKNFPGSIDGEEQQLIAALIDRVAELEMKSIKDAEYAELNLLAERRYWWEVEAAAVNGALEALKAKHIVRGGVE